MIGTLGASVRQYVEETIAANKKLKNAMPKDESHRALARKLLNEIMKQHQEETGESFIILKGGSQKTQTPKQEVIISEHKMLVEKYGAERGAMNEQDLNRGFLVRCCENYVLALKQKADSRIQIRVTLRDLLEHATKELPFMADMLSKALLPTLVSDGWVLFNQDGETRILPYGKGVPSYDASECSADHPMWSRTLDDQWVV